MDPTGRPRAREDDDDMQTEAYQGSGLLTPRAVGKLMLPSDTASGACREKGRGTDASPDVVRVSGISRGAPTPTESL